MKLSRLLLAAVLVLFGAVATAPAHADSTVKTTQLRASDEVPANDSKGTGHLALKLSADGNELHYRLVVANIDNVSAAHIHLAPAGSNGPVVAFLYGPAAPGGGRSDGVLATGTITSASLIGPLTGQPLSALLDQIEAGNAYVNVHTNDGVAPGGTGPGDLPAGEIRGQLR